MHTYTKNDVKGSFNIVVWSRSHIYHVYMQVFDIVIVFSSAPSQHCLGTRNDSHSDSWKNTYGT